MEMEGEQDTKTAKSLLVDFASATSGHGFAKIVGTKSTLHRVIWIFLLVVCIIFVCGSVGDSVWKYFQYDVVTESYKFYKRPQKFPSVTICNKNWMTRSKMVEAFHYEDVEKPLLASQSALCTLDECDGDTDAFRCITYPSGCCVSNLTLCDGYHDCLDGLDERECGGEHENTGLDWLSYFNPEELAAAEQDNLVKDGSWKLIDRHNESEGEEITLMYCMFSGVHCTTKWFAHKSTEFGQCYTFNSNQVTSELTEDKIQLPLEQKNSGRDAGLNLVIDVQSYEYMRLPYGPILLGLSLSIHDPDVSPNMKSQGRPLSVGFHTDVEVSVNEMKIMEAPWGDCDENRKLNYSDRPYSKAACLEECTVNYLIETCGCDQPILHTLNTTARVCNNGEAVMCAFPTLTYVSSEEHNLCAHCKFACEETFYSLKTSMMKFAEGDVYRTAMNDAYFKHNSTGQHATNENFYSESVVSVSVYYSGWMVERTIERPAMEFTTILSNVGGLLGLFIGFSVLTIVEIIETVCLAVWVACRKKSRKDNSVVYPMQSKQ